MSQFGFSPKKQENGGQPTLTFDPFVFTVGAFAPGQAEAFAESIEDPVKKAICAAELAFYKGHPEQCADYSRQLKESGEMNALIASFLIDVISAMSLGNTDLIFEMLDKIDKASPFFQNDERLHKTVDYFLLYFSILTHNREGLHFPEVSVNAFAVPDPLMPMAIYAYAHYLILCGDYGRAIGLAEGTLIRMRGEMPVSEIYLSIITSIGYICRTEWDKAEYYFRHAWKLAKPDGLFMPFAEHKGMLSGMVGKCLKTEDPEAYKTISSLFHAFHKNWVFVHNSLTGDHVTDKLTGTELNVAMLASKGLTNQEIAEFLCISVNSVRSHLRNIFNKLCIDNRKQLSEFIIK